MNSVILEALIRPHSRLDMYILFLIASNLKFAIKWAGNQAIQFVFWIQFWNLNCGVMYLFWVIAKSSNCFWKPPNGHLATLIISSVRFYLSRKVFGVCVFRGGGGFNDSFHPFVFFSRANSSLLFCHILLYHYAHVDCTVKNI